MNVQTEAELTTSPFQKKSRLLDAARWSNKLFNGNWTEATTSITVREPATGDELGQVGESRPQDIDKIVERAAAAQAAWSAWSAEARGALCRRAAQILEDDRPFLLDAIIRETGGVRGKAEVELQGSIDELMHSAAILIQPEGHILPSRDSGD